MIHGLALSAGGAMASQHRMAVLSNNLANVGTVGFKRDLATFRVAPLEADIRGLGSAFRHPVADGIGGGIFAQPTFTDLKTGPIRNTQSDNDLAIAGEHEFSYDELLTVSDAIGRETGREVQVRDLRRLEGLILREILTQGSVIKNDDPDLLGRRIADMLDFVEDWLPTLRIIQDASVRRLAYDE